MLRRAQRLRTNFNCQLLFNRPIFEFTSAPTRFFSMVFDCLAAILRISTTDFSVRGGNSPAEVYWKYSLFGGNPSVTLYTDRLAFDFPNISQSDHELVIQIVQAVHNAFPTAFPELHYERADIQFYEHLQLLDGVDVQEFLSPHAMKSVPDIFGQGRVIQKPAAKFELVSEDHQWVCTSSIERSLLHTSAVFIATTMSLLKTAPGVPYTEKAALVGEIHRSCLATFGLEVKNGAE